MPDDRTVLEHLLEGRDALQQELDRLTAAIDQLDSVLGRIGATDRASRPNGTNGAAASDELAESEPEPDPSESEPVNPSAQVETSAPSVVPARTRSAARKSPRKTASRSRRQSGEPPKSIRVHVLEMLQAENREFGLAEIIDRVHDAGIQAHDDAVRSITIKLMKDGRVERVGRGQYRLTRRGGAARASAAVATAPRVTEAAPEPVADPESESGSEFEFESDSAAEPLSESARHAAPSALESEQTGTADGDDDEPANGDEPEQSFLPSDESDDATGSDEPSAPSGPAEYTPPLNLGQPWQNT